MRRLSYKKVFSKYTVSISDRLARLSYSLYKRIRIGLSKWFPLKEYEKYRFDEHDALDKPSSDMPLGYNYESKKDEEGFIYLKYIDFYDYLPKENISSFKKALQKFALKNKPARFGPYRTAKDHERIDNMGRYVDWRSFTNLHVVTLTHNVFLKEYAPQVAVSLMNLSSSFLVVKYRFYINQSFNERLKSIFQTKYSPYSEPSRSFDVSWYKPYKFGRAFCSGDNARAKERYMLISDLKWKAFRELRRYFTICFEKNRLFTPTFETYSTNIRPSTSNENRSFWSGIMTDLNPDYAPRYNACVCWDRDCEQHEGIKLSAYCGGKYSSTDYLPEIAEHDISDIYAVYMTASSIRRVAERDIAICNKQISKAIRNAKASSILRTRVDVEKTLYYSYRFISEFTGDTIDRSDVSEFKNQMFKDGSASERFLKGIPKSTSETKTQIDTLLKILNDAAEFVQQRANMKLQLFMMLVTILSLIVAVIALADFEVPDWKSIWETICNLFKK